jgi:hypothetical protein
MFRSRLTNCVRDLATFRDYDTIQFPDVLSILEQGANGQSLCCYMLLNSRHISAVQDQFQVVHHNYFIYRASMSCDSIF